MSVRKIALATGIAAAMLSTSFAGTGLSYAAELPDPVAAVSVETLSDTVADVNPAALQNLIDQSQQLVDALENDGISVPNAIDPPLTPRAGFPIDPSQLLPLPQLPGGTQIKQDLDQFFGKGAELIGKLTDRVKAGEFDDEVEQLIMTSAHSLLTVAQAIASQGTTAASVISGLGTITISLVTLTGELVKTGVAVSGSITELTQAAASIVTGIAKAITRVAV